MDTKQPGYYDQHGNCEQPCTSHNIHSVLHWYAQASASSHLHATTPRSAKQWNPGKMNCTPQQQAAHPQRGSRVAMGQDHVRGIGLQLRRGQLRGCLVPQEQRACTSRHMQTRYPKAQPSIPHAPHGANHEGHVCQRVPCNHLSLVGPGVLQAACLSCPPRQRRPRRRTHAAGEAAVGGAQARAQAGVQRRALAGSDGAGLQVRARAVRDQHALLRAAPHLAPAAARNHVRMAGLDTLDTKLHHTDTSSAGSSFFCNQLRHVHCLWSSGVLSCPDRVSAIRFGTRPWARRCKTRLSHKLLHRTQVLKP